MPELLTALRRPFIFDLRALALLRAAVAAVLLTDLAIRSTDLEAHYSNMGVLPLPVLFEHNWHPYLLSLHSISGLWQVQAVLFILAAVAAVALLLGYHTRLATAVSWVLLLSLQNRNPLISQGGDDLLRMLVFWGFFLPWGRVYSWDARKKPTPTNLNYFSAATVAYVVQLALVYWCTALLKSGAEWTTEGTAIYYALSLDQVLMPGGKLIYHHPDLLRFLTFTTYYLEKFLPFVLFLPFGVPWWRLLFVAVMFGFHIGISLTLFVGLFFLINLASVLGLLPPVAMDWLERWVVPATQRLRPQVAARLAPWQTRLAAWQRPVSFRVESSVQISEGLRRLMRSMRDGLVVGVLAYVCWWNLDNIVDQRWTMREPARWLGFLVRIDQHWGMFAPSVFKDDGWYILDATTTDERHIDLNRKGKPTTYDKPASVMRLFKNDRWRKYSENYLFISNIYMRPYYCNYLLRIWSERHPNVPLKHLDVIYMKEVTQPDYQPVTPTREVLCGCDVVPQ